MSSVNSTVTNDDKNLFTTFVLQDLVAQKNYCAFAFLNKCNNKNCGLNHIEDQYSHFLYFIKNPMKITEVNDFNEFILSKIYEIFTEDTKPYFTTCLFCLKGTNCNNLACNRYIEIKSPISNSTFKICYPDKNKCSNKITCGFHINFKINFKNNKLSSISLLDYDEKNIFCKEISDLDPLPSFSKSFLEKKNIKDKQDDFDLNKDNFPLFNNGILKKSNSNESILSNSSIKTNSTILSYSSLFSKVNKQDKNNNDNNSNDNNSLHLNKDYDRDNSYSKSLNNDGDKPKTDSSIKLTVTKKINKNSTIDQNHNNSSNNDCLKNKVVNIIDNSSHIKTKDKDKDKDGFLVLSKNTFSKKNEIEKKDQDLIESLSYYENNNNVNDLYYYFNSNLFGNQSKIKKMSAIDFLLLNKHLTEYSDVYF